MKKFAATIIVLLVAGLWVMPVQRANAQSEIERVESEIRELEDFAERCAGLLDKLQPPGPTASAKEWAAYEEELSSYERCAASVETRLKWLRERLGRLPTPPDTTEPRERTKWRKKTDELEKRVTAAEERKKKVKERLKKLRKAIKPKQPAPGFTAENGSSDGLSIGTFSTRQGKLKMNLPENRAAGDTISGTVIAEPSGQTEAERANNLKELESFVFVVDGKPIKLASDSQNPASVTSTTRNFTTQLPNPPPSIDVTLVTLKDKDGVEKAECPLPLDQTNPPRAMANGPKEFQFPTTSQNGRPLEIVGPFDGNMNTTEIKIGGQPARLLAESPNSCLVLAPDQNFGPTEITVKEGDVEAKGSCRNLGVHLNAPKTSLLKGESTTVTIEVSGLEGIQKDVPLQLESKGVINMEGGNFQNLLIHPKDVQPGGRFTTTRTITGVVAGGFGVTATVIVDRYDMCLAGFGGILQWLSFTGEYRFRRRGGAPAGGTQTGGTQTGGEKPADEEKPTGTGEITGTGKMVMKGCIITLTHNAPDRRVFATLDACNKTGNAEVQVNPDKTKVEITDSNTADNTCGSKK